MAYILKNQSSGAVGSRRFAALIAFVGFVLTIGQIAYISKTGNALCLNGGCAIVESLTRLPPIFFNMAGAAFFFVVLIFSQFARNDRGGRNVWSRLAGLLLLLAMAMEGVLVAFQLQVSRAWCAYCLLIFACIFLLNLSLGWRQFIQGLAMFAAVVVTSASLDYSPSWDMSDAQPGSYGEIVRPNAAVTARLYFSASCPHCEEVISSLGEDVSCEIGFYPLDTVPELPVAGLKKNPRYDSAVNRAVLQGLGLNEVPVLMARENKDIRVITGKEAILAFLERCRPAPSPRKPAPERQAMTPNGQSIKAPVGNNADESCPVGVSADCPSPAPASMPGQTSGQTSAQTPGQAPAPTAGQTQTPARVSAP